MKIAHITTIDGSLRYLLLNQLRSLKEEGYEVIGISRPGSDVGVLEESGIRHIPIRFTRSFSPLADLAALADLYCIMRREGFTIVHTHTPKPGLLGQIAARVAGVPIVVNTLHGFYFHEHMKPFLRKFFILTERIAALCSDVILSQNQEDIQTALDAKISVPNKMRLLGNGIELGRFSRMSLNSETITKKQADLGIHPGTPVVGFVGRLVVEKGIHELFAAAQIILRSFPSAQFLIVGDMDSEKKDAVRPEMAAKYGVEKACIFSGFREDVEYLYAMMSVFVLPSHREGFPRSLMEATASGVPCVATNVRGCREVVEHEKNGFLVPPHNPGCLADAIAQILEDPELAARLSEGGRRMAGERFDEQAVFRKVKAEYVRLLREKGLEHLRSY